MKGCHAVLSALLFLIPPAARAADDLGGAARELARKTSVFGKADPTAIAWRNISSLGPAELAKARAVFESVLQEIPARNAAAPPLTVRITLSQNPTQYLLVEEAQSADERQVWIAAWKRAAPRSAAPGIGLESKLVYQQDEPILDVAFPADAVLVLSPSRVLLQDRTGAQSAAIASSKPWPRDLRGHLRLTGNTFQAFLPGMTCAGAAAAPLHIECHAGDAPWVLESGSRAILLAGLPDRNFFDGRVVLQTGQRKTVAPFYTAAAFEDQGRTAWVLALLDGRAQIFDSAFDPQGSFTLWGSDIAGLDGRCGAASLVIATRPGDGSEPDAVQAFTISNGTPAPLTAPVTFAGPVTALWPAGPSSVVAVAHDLTTGKYAAYVLTVICGS